MDTFTAHTVEETKNFARALAKKEKGPLFISFQGGLGAGKTTFIKSFVSEFLEIEESEISSPTFIYMHNYENFLLERKVYHFDLYRLENHEPFLSMGFDDFFPEASDNGVVVLMEWSEKITPFLPTERIDLIFTVLSEDKRQITVIDRRESGPII